MHWIVALALLWFTVPVTEDAGMEYTVQMLPARIASALPAFAASLPGGESHLASVDLAIGRNGSSRYRFGVAERRVDPASPVQGRFLDSVDDDGKLGPIDPPTPVGASDLVVPGDVARAILVAMAARKGADDTAPLASVGWRVNDDLVTVMFVPARLDTEGAIVGGATSIGAEKHYEVSRKELKVVRTTLAR